jgi:hypothetical protein
LAEIAPAVAPYHGLRALVAQVRTQLYILQRCERSGVEPKISFNGEISVTVDITNTGSREGDEVVQL